MSTESVDEHINRWKDAFSKNGSAPMQAPVFIAAETLKNDADSLYVIDAGGELSAFR